MKLKLTITMLLAVWITAASAQMAEDTSAATMVAGTDTALAFMPPDTVAPVTTETVAAPADEVTAPGIPMTGPLATGNLQLAAEDTTLKPKWYKHRLVKQSIFPLALIGYSLTIFKDNGLYSNYDAKRDIRKTFGTFSNPADNFMIWAPYVEIGVLNAFKIKCKTDLLNTSLLILKSELIMAAIVFPVKTFSKELRPDSSNYQSFPSGHTAEAFVAASVVHKEYRHLSPWYGVGAYAIATSVAAFRMLNNKHWQSDVIAGAGIGLLSTHIAYATHRYRWGRKDVCFVPTIGNGMRGGTFVLNF